MPGLVDGVGCGSTAVTKLFFHGNVVVTLPAEAPGIQERRRSNRAVARIRTSRSDTGGQEMELRHGRSNGSPRTLLVLAAGLGAVLALSACAGGGEGSSPEPMEPAANEEAEPTSVVPVTTAQPPGTTSPPTTTEPSPQWAGTPAGAPAQAPVYDANGLPQVNASPRRGGTGATIHVDGYGFTAHTGEILSRRCGWLVASRDVMTRPAASWPPGSRARRPRASFRGWGRRWAPTARPASSWTASTACSPDPSQSLCRRASTSARAAPGRSPSVAGDRRRSGGPPWCAHHARRRNEARKAHAV
jgi:hypothetical protein